MFNLTRFNPLQEIDKIFMDNFDFPRFTDFFADKSIPVNIYNTKDALIVYAAIPGVNKEDVEVLATKDSLVIAGEVKPPVLEEGGTLIFGEQSTGKFKRTFRIPVQIQPDKVTANVKDGMLEIRLPKAEENKAYQIDIK